MHRLPLAFATLLVALAGGCAEDPERADMIGLWGRVVDGRHEVWELQYSLDVTGLEDVQPAFRWYNYAITESPVEAMRGRWDVIRGTWVVTPSWGLDAEVVNRSVLRRVEEVTERQIEAEIEGSDDVEIYTTLSSLPEPRGTE